MPFRRGFRTRPHDARVMEKLGKYKIHCRDCGYDSKEFDTKEEAEEQIKHHQHNPNEE